MIPSRLTLILGGTSAILLALVVTLFLKLNVVSHDLKQAQADQKELLVVRKDLTICQGNTRRMAASVQYQNEQVEKLRAAGDTAQAQADARVAAEQSRTRVSEAQRQVLLNFRPRTNETVCEAAFRLHKENVQ